MHKVYIMYVITAVLIDIICSFKTPSTEKFDSLAMVSKFTILIVNIVQKLGQIVFEPSLYIVL